MVNVTINEDEINRRLHDYSTRKVVNALRSAISTTTTWTEKELEKRMAADSGVPIGAFRRHRVFKRIIGGYSNGTMERGRVWEGYIPIRAKFVGRLKQDEGGAWAGRYYFEGGFLARARSGFTVYKRSATQRQPDGRPGLEEQAVRLLNAVPIAENVSQDAGNELVRRFREKFV